MTGRTISIRSTIFPEKGLHASWDFWLLLLAALLVSPLQVVAATLLAAAMHEGGHLLLLSLFHVPVEGVRLSAFGAVIYARGVARLSYGHELLVTLAGPAVNLLAAPIIARFAAQCSWEWGWLFAGAHVLLGVYNLLPIPPLDGGRALYLLLAWRWGPTTGDTVSALVGAGAAAILVALGAHLTLAFGGAFFLLAALGLFLPQVRLAKTALNV